MKAGRRHPTLRPVRVAFQGDRGAFSEAAARKLLGPYSVTVPQPTFSALFGAITTRAADVIVAPVENTLAGAVQPVLDLLARSRLRITREVVLRVEQHVIGLPGTKVRDIRRVESHPVALAQCERFLAAHPHIARIAAEDTAGSVRHVVALGDRTRAAIAGELAARTYGARILRRNVSDHADNFTRFVLLEPATTGARAGAANLRDGRSADRLSLTFELRHQPGALLRALQPFAAARLNLLRIESRPIPGRPWEYRFFLDIAAQAGPPLSQALKGLKSATRRMRLLGHYPQAKER